jgi:hypothetical protein
MNKAWVDLIVKVAIEVVDFVANMLKEDKENQKNDGKGTSKKK